MCTQRFQRRRCSLWALLLTLLALGASAASPKRVLILNPYGRDVLPFSSVASAFRTTLVHEFGEALDIYEAPLELTRLGGVEGEGPLVTFLAGQIQSHPVDLVVPIGLPAVQFTTRHREHLFPDTPLLAVGAVRQELPPAFLQTNATLVTQDVFLPGIVEDIFQLQPQTTNIVVVSGASALEQFWVGQLRRQYQSFSNRVAFTWLDNLPLGQILKRCSALPHRSFIFHSLFIVDSDGVPYEKSEALRRLCRDANAPVFAYFGSEFGLGPVGGHLYRDSEVGVQGARVAIRILRGEKPGSIPVQVLGPPTPVYDWRELRRWGIREADLPVGSKVQFRQPTFWQLYQWRVLGVAALFLLQAALIGALLLQRVKRRRAESDLLGQRAELAHVTRVSTLGQLTSSIAHELNQPLGAILRNAEAGELMLQDAKPDLEEIRAIFADIRADERRAGDVIDRLRVLLKRGEVARDTLDLGQLTGAVVALVGKDAEMRRVRLALTLAAELPAVQGDRVRLQQVLLNLLLNAIDAVQAKPPGDRVVTVRTQTTGAAVEVSVSDNGPGIPADLMPRLCTPFVTSKPNGLGMGLAISRSIIEEHGGRLSMRNEPAGGATFTIRLPGGKA